VSDTVPFTTDHGLQRALKPWALSAVKALWKRKEVNLHNDNGAIYETFIDTFLKTKKPNRLAYKILVRKKTKKNYMDTQRK